MTRKPEETLIWKRMWRFSALRFCGAVLSYALYVFTADADNVGSQAGASLDESARSTISLGPFDLPLNEMQAAVLSMRQDFYVEFALLVALGVFLTSIIAYHPLIRFKMETVDEIDAPKTYLMYAAAGVIIGTLVSEQPVVAFVIFGIGGLFRFRTDVGSSRETGRLLVVTLSGLCCGLGSPGLAFTTVILVFALVYLLERTVTYRLQVVGVENGVLDQTSSLYRTVLENLGCRVLRNKASPLKQQIVLVFRAGLDFQESDFEKASREALGEQCTGVLNWQKN